MFIEELKWVRLELASEELWIMVRDLDMLPIGDAEPRGITFYMTFILCMWFKVGSLKHKTTYS